ncbi:MAG: AI-2E family transporter [Clostridia bacterium]|nr:AI-2E family transporter [Clostridia bacterium]
MQLQKTKGHKVYMIAALAVAIVGILLYAIVNIQSINAFINRVWVIFAPVVYGFCLAYLCNPIMKVFDNHIFKKIKLPGLRRALSLTMTVLVVLIGIAVIIGLLVPEIVRSIQHLFTHYDDYLEEVISIVNNGILWLEKVAGMAPEENQQYISVDEIKIMITDAVNSIFDSSKSILQQITEIFDENSTSILKKLFDKLFPYTGTLISKIYVFIIEAFFSILIALHLLATKETRLAQVKKMRKAIFTYEQNKFINNVLKIINDSFGSYLEGKLLDALIIFVLCWGSFAIFGISDYNLLIAALIGITDIIPVVGPFIGAIPGGFIILITNPSKFILYVIIVLLIQQLEGNIISPKILGQHMGVSALCVLISIVVMGTIFAGNPIALIISVPLFAVMVELGKMFIEHRLKKKGLPTDTAEYYRGAATEDEIDFAVHYQNRKLTYYYEHSILKKWLDKRREEKELRKQQKAEAAAAEAVNTDVAADTQENEPDHAADQTETKENQDQE